MTDNTTTITAINTWFGPFAIVPILYYSFFFIASSEWPVCWKAFVASFPAYSIILPIPPGC